MEHALIYHLFRLGRLPLADKKQLQAEGVQQIVEGIHITVTYRNYKAPGKYFSYKSQMLVGSIALTQQRIIAYAINRKIMNIAYAHKGFAQLSIRTETDYKLLIGVDASIMNSKSSGSIEFCFHTCKAGQLMEQIKSLSS
jgi:hypothetical protein